MAEVKWIKIVTDIFDDEKILLIETLPEADSIIVIWFKLLCLAGKQNNSGVFVMGDKIPYTDKMLATIFRRKENIVELALKTFEQFEMIEIIDNVITIPNWEKHQTLDQLELAREQTRKRVAKHREKQKNMVNGKDNCNVTVTLPVTQCNGDRIDKIRIDKNRSKVKEDNIHFAEFVTMTNTEYEKLVSAYGKDFTNQCITILDNYKGANGKKYKSDYRAILNWVIDKAKQSGYKPKEQKQEYRANKMTEDEYIQKLKAEGKRYV